MKRNLFSLLSFSKLKNSFYYDLELENKLCVCVCVYDDQELAKLMCG